MLSLRTRGFREAEHLAALLDRAFATAWGRAVEQESAGADLGAVLRRYLREALARDLDLRLSFRGEALYANRLDPHPIADPLDDDLAAISDLLAEAREALARCDTDSVAGEARDLMARHKLPREMWGKLTYGVLAANVRALEAAQRRTLGEAPAEVFDLAEAVAPIASNPAPAPPPPAKPLASTLVQPFFERREKRDKATHQVMGQERGTLRRFMEVCGDLPAGGYGRGNVTGFLDTLRQLPNTYGRAPRDKNRTLAEIIAETKANGAERLKDKTIKRHLSALSQFFHFARDQGHLSNAQRAELVEDHRFNEERSARDQRDAWAPDELTALFASPVWTGCASAGRRAEPGTLIIQDARFWLPILALYQGARLEELADLYRRDVRCEAGTWTINIVETEGNPESGDRRLKTKNASRTVPLHPEIVRLGFLRHVSEIAPSPDDPLFPDLKPQGRDGKRGPRITRWFVEYRRAIDLYRDGVGMHAFRHTAITRLTDAITTFQQKRHRDFMMGHGGAGTEGDVRYDKGADVRALAETLALLQYPELDLRHLHRGAEVERAGDCLEGG